MDYAVGYGKPPQEHRFKPGKSGNPNGRPKKDRQPPDSLMSRIEATTSETMQRLQKLCGQS